MIYSKKFKSLTLCATVSVILLAGQSALAHTTLQTKTVKEGETVYNNAQIGHGCNGQSVLDQSVRANSIVFPDGVDSIIKGGGQIIEGATVDDYLTGYGNKARMVMSKDVFPQSAEKFDNLNNRVAFHSWGGLLPGTTLGLVPIRTDAFTINEESCAKSVKLKLAIADICITGLNRPYNPVEVNLWTPAVEGSNYNGDPAGHGYNSPASLTITRVSPLPAECGEGFKVNITPSAAQINRDLPIPGVWSLAP
jgi:hypothetical protein